MTFIRPFLHVILLSAVSALSVQASVWGCFETIAQWPYGPATVSAVGDGIASLGFGSTMQIAEIDGAGGLEVVGSIVLPSSVWGIEVRGDLVYVTGGFGLRVIDIGVPDDPVVVGTYDTNRPVRDLAVGSDVVFLMMTDVIFVVDVSNPAQPSKVGQSPRLFFNEISLDGSLLVASTSSAGVGLVVFDVSNREDPIVVGVLDVGVPPAISAENHVVAAAGIDLFRTIDISDPTRPVEVGSLQLPDGTRDVSMVSGRAYLAGTQGLVIVDVSDPEAPALLGHLGISAVFYQVATDGSTAVVSDYEDFRAVDVTDPTLPGVVGHLDGYGQILDVVTDGTLDYAVADGLGIRILGQPSLGVLSTLGLVPRTDVGSMAASDGLLTLFTSDGLTNFDVTIPSDPVEIGHLGGFRGGAGDRDGETTVLAGRDGLLVVDNTDPTNPLALGHLDGRADRVVVSGDYAYALYAVEDPTPYDYWYDLHVVDLTDPANPISVGSTDCNVIVDIAVSGETVFAADPYWGLCVIDVSDPTNPTKLGRVGNPAQYVAVASGLAYVVGSSDELSVYDVRDPSNPRLVGHIDDHPVFPVGLSPGSVHAARGFDGLTVYRACSFPTRSGSSRRRTP